MFHLDNLLEIQSYIYIKLDPLDQVYELTDWLVASLVELWYPKMEWDFIINKLKLIKCNMYCRKT